MTLRFPASLVAVYLVASALLVLGQAEEQAADVEFDNNWNSRLGCKCPEGQAEKQAADVHFDNNWNSPLDFECPEGQVITSVYSIHGDSYHDRRFKFGCRKVVDVNIPDFCRWTPSYVNVWKQPLGYACPRNFAIAGVSSFYLSRYEDRRWRFKCCRDNDYIGNPCAITDYLNDFDQVLNFTASARDVIRGWMSWYDGKTKDRRHQFLTCTMTK
ncbi:hemagglutinin/amebocyte aggregation factor-like [Elysia marginata]|uniref:Hemagglutinin/amebocyte aggregation factor-like n=1 Tax=Elysia marginata TaxID=1093978 RepID=A0AAV4EMP2_9GAST|nr:hemagglutinin/amebocyte aggregation factor-like [Elysia marginata]